MGKPPKKIYKLDKDSLEIVKEYESIRQAARENYIEPNCIRYALEDLKRTSVGFKWCLVEAYSQ